MMLRSYETFKLLVEVKIISLILELEIAGYQFMVCDENLTNDWLQKNQKKECTQCLKQHKKGLLF